ncbi:ODF3A protein, partial [Formicarius rufipectus]|nr:ODF3A protein [Formicarius rufipectus]
LTMSNNGWVGTWRPHVPRGPIAAQYRTPGPKYGLPSNVGYPQHDPTRHRAPAYSFGLRLKDQQQSRTPGPKYLVRPGFTARGKDGIPAYTMCGRPRPDRLSNTPGPGECGAQSPAAGGRPSCRAHSSTSLSP